ncbi:MAG: hypothetical protein ACLRPC_00075 [Streptococcus sp.]
MRSSLSKALPSVFLEHALGFFIDAVPEGVDIQKVKSDLEQLDHVASINQLNLWTMDGLEKERRCPCTSRACQPHGGL